MCIRLVIFLLINFAALAIGGFTVGFFRSLVSYLNKAPDSSRMGFCAAWTSIMVCFRFLWRNVGNLPTQKHASTPFSVQWILNVGWNPLFSMHLVFISLVVILLTGLIAYFFFSSWHKRNLFRLVLPYFIWLMITVH